MKKIVFVTGCLGGGGSERVLTLVANQLRKRNYDVSIIAFSKRQQEYENECPVTVLKFTNDFSQIAALRKTIKEKAPDSVVAFEYYVGMKTVLATRGLAVKVVVSERNDPHMLDGQPLKKILRNFLYALSDTLVCQTDDAKAYFGPWTRAKTVVIPNPIKDGLPHWNADTHRRVILNFCRLEKQKNLFLLLDAFKAFWHSHPEYSLEIYGEGSEKKALEMKIKKEGLQANASVYPFSENIHDIAANCAVFVSSSDYEGLSNSMLEAMAIGMPVVCTDCPIGGAKMVMQNETNGYLVPTGDAVALQKAICKMIEEPENAKKMAACAAKIRETLSIDRIVDQWEKLIKGEENA